jgi:hypothetical protein
MLQVLLNQLAILRQLNSHQLAPSAGQSIGQTPLVIGQLNTQGSSGAGRLMAPNLHPRAPEDQPLETPSAELKSHMKQELIDHFSKMLQKQYGIKPT